MKKQNINKGFFITFEGPEGSGKSTQVKLLAEFLDSEGISYILTREPGGTDFAEKIRGILKDTSLNKVLSLKTEALLFQAARAQHVFEKIKPALKDGKIVICDRYADSSTVYQGEARGLGKKEIEALNYFSTDNLNPDLTILMDIDPETGLSRAHIRENCSLEKDRFEEQGLSFHKKIREAFLRLASEHPSRYRIINASDEVSVIHNKIIHILRDEFKLF